MTVFRMCCKGLLLLAASSCLFTGMMYFADTVGLDVLPVLLQSAGSATWWFRMLIGFLMTGAGIAIGLGYRALKRRWNPDDY